MKNVIHLSAPGRRSIGERDQIPSRGILDVAAVSIAVIGAEGQLKYANHAPATMIDQKVEDCIGTALEGLHSSR